MYPACRQTRPADCIDLSARKERGPQDDKVVIVPPGVRIHLGEASPRRPYSGRLPRITSVFRGCLLNFLRILKKILHLWKFPVISNLRTNFAEMPGNRSYPGAARRFQGRRGGESESLEEEAIEIGNS